jgi:hypothetical protein
MLERDLLAAPGYVIECAQELLLLTGARLVKLHYARSEAQSELLLVRESILAAGPAKSTQPEVN